MTDRDNGDEVPIKIEEGEHHTPRERFETEAGRAAEGLERGVVDVLAWLLETETRSRIYIYLRKYPQSTSEEIAQGTGLYPSTVREALAGLHEEGTVTREKRESEGAGNNPFEYRAIPPSELVSGAVGHLQEQLNAVFRMDDGYESDEPRSDEDPITISVDEGFVEDDPEPEETKNDEDEE